MFDNIPLVKVAAGVWEWLLTVIEWFLDHWFAIIVVTFAVIVGVGAIGMVVRDAKNQPDYSNPEEVQGSLAAMMRGSLIDEACYDSTIKQYFIHIAQHNETGKLAPGWFLYKDPVFMRQQNGSFVEVKNGSTNRSVPDTTGLQCRTQKVN